MRADLRDGWAPLVLALMFDAQAPPSEPDRPAAERLKAVIGGL